MTEPFRVISTEEEWRNEVDLSIVEMLEEALVKAKAGEFQGAAVVAVCKTGSTYSGHSKQSHTGLMLAALARAQFRLMATE